MAHNLYGEARSAKSPNMLRKPGCTDGLLQSETVVGTSSMLRVLSVFAVTGEVLSGATPRVHVGDAIQWSGQDYKDLSCAIPEPV